MQVFEFHFNPKEKEDIIYDSFCYEAENIYEKNLGNLYIVGELKNNISQNNKLINILSSTIKKEYYSSPQRNPEQAIKESLKQANQLLENITKEGNVSWLGNLDFSVISVKPLSQSKDFLVNFTKIGNLKVLLLRSGDILDIGQNLEIQNANSYSSRIFGNIATGKFIEGDKIIVFTKEIYDFFIKTNLIKNISEIEKINQKKLKETLKPKEKELKSLYGICFLVLLESEIIPSKEHLQAYAFKSKNPKKSTNKLLLLLNMLFKIVKKLIFIIIKTPYLVFAKIISLLKTIKRKKPAHSKSSTETIEKPKNQAMIKIQKKNLTSVLLLIVLLISSYFIFSGERKKPYEEIQQKLEIIQTKIDLADNSLIYKNNERANRLLQEAWNDVIPLTKIGSPMRKKALNLKQTIEKKLAPLNNVEEIKQPNIILDFSNNKSILVPQKIVEIKNKLFLFNQFSSNLYELDMKNKTGHVLKANRNIFLGTPYNGHALFFSKPSYLIYPKNNKLEEIDIKKPYPDFNFSDFSSFRSSIYFLDKKSGEIAKYSNPFSDNNSTNLWINPKSKKAIGAKSMAVDGNVWILTKNNKIDRYYAGNYRETLKLNLFPPLENPTKIWTSPNCLNIYIMEPNKSRIIVLTKHGEVVKQLYSKKFNDLLYFTVTENEKEILVLNGSTIYQINL